MKRNVTKILSLFIAAVLMFAAVVPAFAEGDSVKDCPTVIIPGLFQSETRLYNDDGTVNDKYSAPFYLEPTNDIVKEALKRIGLPLSVTLITQHDFKGKFADKFAQAVADIVFSKVASDNQGKPLYNIKATDYPTSAANLSERDRKYILDKIPLNDYVASTDLSHLYFLSYNSFGNINEITDRLYNLIETAKKESGSDKVNLIPISQGGSIMNNLLARHPEVISSLKRVIYIVPAVDGSNVIGDLYEYGINDSDDALYGYMWKQITKDETTGALVNLAVRLFPKKVLNNVLDKTMDAVIEKLKYSTAIWALIPSEYYPDTSEKYLDGAEDSYIKSQTDEYYSAQVNAKSNILKMRNAGVEVFDIVNYNYPLYSIADTWNTVNADGIIQLSSTSLGAVSAPVDSALPAGYTQQGNSYGTCSDSSHNHIDPHNMVDASTGLLPDQTFYFCDGDHEKTARNDVIMKLATALLTDDNFTSVYSYPDKYPQFNNARDSREYINDINKLKNYDVSSLSDEQKDNVSKVLASSQASIDNTNVDLDEYNKTKTEFYAVYDDVFGTNHNETKKSNAFVLWLEKQVAKTVGNKGYSDVFRISGS